MKAVKRRNDKSKGSSLPEGGTLQLSRNRRVARPPASPPTTIELRGVQIHFPFKPYACQEDYMGKVLDALLRSENALLESPTGTGKTLCLLCATLAWQREQSRKLKQQDIPTVLSSASNSSKAGQKPIRKVPTIIYASRTHSQLSQVVKELQNTRYRPKHAVLGSREQMCVNPKVKKANSTASEINHDCNKLGKERKCHYKNKLDGFQAPPNESGSTFGMQPVMDMEDLVTMGKQHKVCPFFYTRSKVEEAELILLPYNYLFDKDSRTTTLSDIPWDNSVIIFDEAHNLESFASESASFDLSSTDITRCIKEIDRAINYCENFPEHENKIKKDNIGKLKGIFFRLEEYILNLSNEAAHRGEYMMDLFQKGSLITHANHELFIMEVRKVIDIFLDVQGGTSSKGAPGLEHFVQCVKRVYGEPTEARCLAKAQSYRVHITPKTIKKSNDGNSVSGRTVSYWCFAPSEAMRELANLNIRSILVTSGTLSPLESYAMELDLPFPNRLENPHIIEDDQIHVRVIGKGVSGQLLSSSYERRQNADYYKELGNTLVSLSKVVPGGMLIFFPSYGVMQSCLEHWGGPSNARSSKPVNNFFAAKRRKTESRYSFPHAPTTFSTIKETSTPWKRLLGNKAVVIEPRSTSDLPDAISEFHKYLNMPKSRGVALLGVCRGKISEGIDFAHDMCRAVIITGLPFAPAFDPKVKMKREFLDQIRAKQSVASIEDGGFGVRRAKSTSLSGQEWYNQQAHRAVNQAIGRVIRNRNDYGAILLLDSRFGQPSNQQGLSKWVRPHILPDKGIGQAISSLVKFYKQAETNTQSRQMQPPPRQLPNDVSLILQYESDDVESGKTVSDEQKVTKVAIIRKADSSKDRSSELELHNSEGLSHDDDEFTSRSYVPPERIVARLDVNSFDSKKLLKASKGEMGNQDKENGMQKPTRQPKSSQPKPNDNVSLKSVVRVDFGKPSIAGNATGDGQNVARDFFQSIQSLMNGKEISTIRKSVVVMKQFSEKKNRSGFLNAACEIIRILLRYEKFESRSKRNKPELITLFFQLLPNEYLTDCQRWTMYLMLQQSEYAEMLEKSVMTSEFKNFMTSASDLLWEVWFQDQKQTIFLRRLEEILNCIQSSHKGRKGSFEQFFKIFPLEHQVQANALVDNLRASKKIERIKDREMKKKPSEEFTRYQVLPGKQAIRIDLQNVDGKPKASRKKDLSQDTNMKVNNSVANPYKKQFGVEQMKLKSAVSRILETSKPLKNPYQRAVDQSASITFTGKVIEKRLVESNAPKNLTCALCERTYEKPYISDCGHMACWDCWNRWLSKSKSCPTCRKSTQINSLAIAVFKEESRKI